MVLCSATAVKYLCFQYWAWRHHLVASFIHKVATAIKWRRLDGAVVGAIVCGKDAEDLRLCLCMLLESGVLGMVCRRHHLRRHVTVIATLQG